jgi:Zn-dependent M28 family amino/carboxypeptidase
MRSTLFFFLLIATNCVAQPSQIIKISEQISINSLQENLYYLASDKMEGRLFATRGDTLASEFVGDWFKKNNLQPVTTNSNPYFQTVVAYKRNLVSAEFKINQTPVVEKEGWIDITLNPINQNNIPVVFVGYGYADSIYNDLEGIDVEGKAVLLIASYGTKLDSINYNIITKARSLKYSQEFHEKLIKKGAAVILACRFDYNTWHPRRVSRAIRPTYDTERNSGDSMTQLIISDNVANTLLAKDNITIKELDQKIHSTGRPQSFQLKSTFSFNNEIEKEAVKGPNVIAVLPGTDAKAGHIIVCAHHDHEGMTKTGIYYGAVDNASGTVAIMEIAALLKMAAQKRLRPKRSIVFISFTGEEGGLKGSEFYINNPLFPLTETKAACNIDMLGRVDTVYAGKLADSLNYVYTLIKDSANFGVQKAIDKANTITKFKFDGGFQNVDRLLKHSDQYPFYRKGIPIVATFCGFPKEYHQMTDTPDKINYPLLKRQIQLAFLTVWNLAND